MHIIVVKYIYCHIHACASVVISKLKFNSVFESGPPALSRFALYTQIVCFAHISNTDIKIQHQR